MNRGLRNRDVNALAIDPAAPGTLYAGTDGGVFKSTSGGRRWRAMNQGLADSDREIEALILDPTAPATLYIGTYWSGVFTSVDRGASWTPLNEGLVNWGIGALAIDPAGTVLHAGTSGSGVVALQLPEPTSARRGLQFQRWR